MQVKIVNDFQKEIYRSLKGDIKLQKLVKKVHIGPASNIESPFISINISNLEMIVKNNSKMYEIDFNIYSYAKDRHHSQLLLISECIIENLIHLEKLVKSCFILGLKANKISLSKAKDLVLNKVSINYKACIQSRS